MKIRRGHFRAASLLVLLAAALTGCAKGAEPTTASLSTADVPVQLQQGKALKWNGNISYDLPVIDFVDSKTGFAVKERSDAHLRLLSTHDGGTHWQERDLPGEYVRSLDFINAKTGYALAEENCSSSVGQLQCKQISLLKTGDGGRTWNTKWKSESQEDHSQGNPILRMLSFVNEADGAMLVNGRLFLTQDGGAHFHTAVFGIKDFKPISASFPKAGTGYVVGTVGKDDGKLVVVKTSNAGRTWSTQLDISAKNTPLSAFQIQFASGNTGWLLTNEKGTLSGDIYRTVDGGNHWTKMSTQRTGRPYVSGIQLIDGNTGVISLHPGAGPVEGGIWLTKDGGRSFTGVSKAVAVNQVQMVSSKEIWAAVDGMNGSDFLIRSNDGGMSWQESYPLSEPYGRPTEDMAFIDRQLGFGIGTQLDSGKILNTTDGGASWKIIASLDSYIRLEKISFVNEKEGFLMAFREKGPYHVLLKTQDGGLTWHEVPSESLSKLGIADVSAFRFFDTNHGVLFATGEGKTIYRTSDGGKTWSKTLLSKESGSEMKVYLTSFSSGWLLKQTDTRGNMELIRFGADHSAQTVLTLDKDWYPDAVYFGDEAHGYMLFEDFEANDGVITRLLTTADGGLTWTDHPFPADAELVDVRSIGFSDPQHGWIQFLQGTAVTTDGGVSWTVLQ
ncbi:YCF48-related protein [Paenibacillus sp. XY044]|uniref:WD40/YVTN/BNR-like repeat-containing protein n=1 Tax=Paenibacillus sp. XY044 TaxID=2026089 RepID=UPI0015C6256B|nr:YCF48-related protein [Paenibacillus sp. XY044]